MIYRMLSLIGIVTAPDRSATRYFLGGDRRTQLVRGYQFVILLLSLVASVGAVTSVQAQSRGSEESVGAGSPAWKLKLGDHFVVSVVKQVQRTAQLNSKVTVVQSEVQLRFDWKIVEVAQDGTAKIRQVLEQYAISVGDPAVPRQAVAFASDDSPQKLTPAIRKLHRRTKPLVGLESTFSMTAKGEIRDVVLSDESVAELNKLEDSPQVQALLNEGALEEAMRSFSMNAMPEKMEAGRWSRRESQGSGVEVQHSFQLNDAVQIKNKKIATIDVQSSLLSSGDANEKTKAKKNQVLQTVISLDGTGGFDFDVDAGYFPSSEYRSTVVAERKYREKIIQTTVVSTTKMKIEKQ